MNSNRKNQKIQIFFFGGGGLKIEKIEGYPLPFFQIFGQNFLFEISSY